MKHYTAKQINEIKQEIRTGKPVVIIADELAKQWGRPVSGVYTKVLRLSKQTRKITNTYDGPTKRAYTSTKRKLRPVVVQEMLDFTPMPESVLESFSVKEQEVIEEVCQDIINIPEELPVMERQPAEIGIELPAGVMSFTGTPSKVVVYSDHVRYYFNN
jgi:hypothetical protein